MHNTTSKNSWCDIDVLHVHKQIQFGECFLVFSSEFLSSRLLSKIVRIEIYRVTVMPFYLYGCETWSLTLREEHKFRISENRKCLDFRGDEITVG
jgi:hypothetical protein